VNSFKKTAPSLQRGGARVSTEKIFGEAKLYLQLFIRSIIRAGSSFSEQKTEIFCLAPHYPNPGLPWVRQGADSVNPDGYAQKSTRPLRQGRA